VRGDHLSMLAEPNLKSLAQTLKECLTEAQETARTSTPCGKLSRQAE
jgi:thioesterase domain-containing protein